MSRPWNDWYHCVGSTYGSWLPGDSRGWRERHHRVHVEGDYKSPPPAGAHDRLHEYTKHLMKRDVITLDPTQRRIVFDVLREALAYHGIGIAAISVSKTHTHLLAQFQHGRRTTAEKLISDPASHFFGIARKRASRRLSEQSGVSGGVWSKHTKVIPIVDHNHFENTRRYIRNHADEGAVVWVNESNRS